jgi:hypothetical protein
MTPNLHKALIKRWIKGFVTPKHMQPLKVQLPKATVVATECEPLALSDSSDTSSIMLAETDVNDDSAAMSRDFGPG